jgi:hypothetical protein
MTPNAAQPFQGVITRNHVLSFTKGGCNESLHFVGFAISACLLTSWPSWPSPSCTADSSVALRATAPVHCSGIRGRPMRVGCRDCLNKTQHAPGICAVTISSPIHQCMGDQSYAVFVWSTLNAAHAEHLTLVCPGSHKRVELYNAPKLYKG